MFYVYLFFHFDGYIYTKYRQEDRFPLRLTVYLRDPFKWDGEKRKGYKDRDRYLDWTKEDEEKYGDLIVTTIKVAGEYNENDYENSKGIH